jgi:hypothetical protein
MDRDERGFDAKTPRRNGMNAPTDVGGYGRFAGFVLRCLFLGFG